MTIKVTIMVDFAKHMRDKLAATPTSKAAEILPHLAAAVVPEIDLDALLSTLNSGQRAAFDMLVRLLEGETAGPVVVLKGYAGTGKTYLVSRFIMYVVSAYKLNLAVTAPTNKAVKVARKAALIETDSVTYRTTHSALGLKEDISPSGKISFKADRYADNPLQGVGLMFIDEVSMLGDDLFTEVELHTQRGLKVILIGDPKQIPPVGQRDTVAFTPERKAELGIETAELSEIVRQSAGNPIISLTEVVRDRINFPGCYRDLYPGEVLPGPLGVRYVSLSDDEEAEYVGSFIEKLFTSDEFKKDADYAKIIAWKNATVDTYNGLVRSVLFPEDSAKIEVGEKLIANKPIKEQGIQGAVTVFSTNDEFEVVELTLKEYVIGEDRVKYYDTLVRYEPEEGVYLDKRIPIIHEDGEENFNRLAEEKKAHALRQPKGSNTAKMAWVSYYRFQEIFADVKYNYAITAHKSQGSTYQYVIVAENDINTNTAVRERNRIKYTAFSRAAKYLVVIGD